MLFTQLSTLPTQSMGRTLRRDLPLRDSHTDSPAKRAARLPATVVACLVALLFQGTALAAGDGQSKAKPARPVAELVAVCAACHGEDGKGTAATFPNLGGQHRDYLLYSLKAYKSGSRDNAIMKAQVTSLTNDEMASLAKWYARQSAQVYTPSRSEWLTPSQ